LVTKTFLAERFLTLAQSSGLATDLQIPGFKTRRLKLKGDVVTSDVKNSRIAVDLRQPEFFFRIPLKYSFPVNRLKDAWNSSRAISYAINEHPAYIHMAIKSIETLRAFNQKIKVQIFYYGRISTKTRSSFENLNVKIIRRNYVSPRFDLMMKWISICELQSEKNVFVDADTVFIKDPAHLFLSLKKANFLARIESKTSKKSADGQINYSLFNAIRKHLNVKARPIFNTGVMVFNRTFVEELRKNIPFFYWVQFHFKKSPELYPSRNTHLAEEISFSLTLGRMKSLKLALISKKRIPLYEELSATSTGEYFLIHFGTHYAEQFYRSFFGESDSRVLRKYLFLGRI